jgi:hypothetical protein
MDVWLMLKFRGLRVGAYWACSRGACVCGDVRAYRLRLRGAYPLEGTRRAAARIIYERTRTI